MIFQVGDEAIHSTHGLGKIVDIEVKNIHEQDQHCYLFRTADLTIYIPIDSTGQQSLRLPTPPKEFRKLFKVLSSNGEPLPEDRIDRKNHLLSRLHDGQLVSIFLLVRDLTHFMRGSKLNDQEKSILERATKSLLTEWSLSMNVPIAQAKQAMDQLLASKVEIKQTV